MKKNIVAVVGATGAQGGSVARHLLERGHFAVRALTRNPRSAAAEALSAAGAEVVRADLFDTESVAIALKGAYGVFGVTSYWEHFEREREHGMNLLDAIAESGIEHAVLSTLPSVHEETNGALQVAHFDIKAEIEQRARALNIPATYVHLAYYFENFLAWFAPQRQSDGSYVLALPQGDTPLAGVAVDDVGGVVARIFERRDEMLGRTQFIAGDELTMQQYADAMARVITQPVRPVYVSREAYAQLGFPGAEDLAAMFEYYRLHAPSRRGDAHVCKSLYSGMRTFSAWVADKGPALRGAA